MSYLIRVMIPDAPGSLGRLADALGQIKGNIESVDVVEKSTTGEVTDDIVVSLPQGTLPDAIISAAQALPGVIVDSIRPFSGRVDRRGQIEMLAGVAQNLRKPEKAMAEFVDVLPRTMTSGWAIVLDNGDTMSRLAASSAAPEDDGTHPPHADVDKARVLRDEEKWVPESWRLLDASLCASPIGNTGLMLVVGRPGGPDFLATEVEQIGLLCDIVGSILK
ncbi:amino acid-binding ACT domain protein [Corynebacterium sp. H130]|uniref:amino acid-binding ACT domain protein n=1 Tax=Corynebacterium sp. H130 TaxID=3133444 RepID=UPI0030AA19DF